MNLKVYLCRALINADNMVLSIIIVSYNVKELLRDCLESVASCQLPVASYEIVVVDNNSSDDSCQMVKENFPLVKLIESKKNLGFGKANNLGARDSKGEFIFFLNPDTKVCSDSLGKIVKFFRTRSQAGIVGPRLLNADNSFQPSVGVYPSILSLLLEKPIDFLERRIRGVRPFLGNFLIKYKKFEKPSEVNWVSGAALACRRKVWESLNGFDENFFMYFEDIDLCLRAKKAGWEVYHLPESEIYHLRGKSQSAKSRKKAEVYYQSQDYFFQKHKGQVYSWLIKVIRRPYQVLDLRTKIGRYY